MNLSRIGKSVGLSAIAATALIMLGGCSAAAPTPTGSSGSGASVTPIDATYVTPSGYNINFAPEEIGASGGYCKSVGLNLTVEGGPGGPASIQQTTSGHSQFGQVSALSLIQNVVNEHVPIVAVGTISQYPIFAIVSPTSAPITSAKQLAGKHVGVQVAGGPTEVFLDLVLADAGIDKKTVTKEVTGPGVAPYVLMKSGQIAASVITLGEVALMKQQGMQVHAWNAGKDLGIPGQVYFTTQDYVKQNPEGVQRFVQCMTDSIGVINGHDGYKKTFDILNSNYGAEISTLSDQALSLAQLGAMAPSFGKGSKVLVNEPDAWKKAYDLMEANGLLTGTGDVTTMYTNQFTDAVKR